MFSLLRLGCLEEKNKSVHSISILLFFTDFNFQYPARTFLDAALIYLRRQHIN